MLSTGSNLGTSSTNYVAPTLVSLVPEGTEQLPASDSGTASVPKELPRSYGQPVGTSDTRVRPERTAALSARLFAELWADAQTRTGASGTDSIRQPYALAERLQALAKESNATPAEIAVTLQILSDGAAEFAVTAVHAMAQGAVGVPGAPQDAAPLDARTLTALVQVAVNTARSTFFPQGVYTPPPASTTADGTPAARWDVVATLTSRTVHAAWAGMAAGLRIAATATSPEEARHVLAATLHELIDTAVDQTTGEHEVSPQEREAAAQAIQDLLPMLAEQLDTVAARSGMAALPQGVAGQVLADAVRGSALFATTDTVATTAVKNNVTTQRSAADADRVEVQSMPLDSGFFDVAQAVMPIVASWNNSFSAAGGALPDAQTLLAPLLAARNGPPPLDAAAMQKLGEMLTERLPEIVDGLVEAMTGGSGNLPAEERTRVQDAAAARVDMTLRLAGAVSTAPQQWTGLLAASDLAQQIQGIVTRSGEKGLRALFAVGHLGERLKGAADTAAAQVAPDDAAARAQLLAGLRADSATLVANVMAQLPDSLLTPEQRARLQNTLTAEIGLLPASLTAPSDPAQALLQDLQLAAGKALQPLMQSPETMTPDKVAQALQPVLAAALAKLPPAKTTDEQIARAQMLQAASAQLGAMAKQLTGRLMLDVPTSAAPLAGLGQAILSSVISQGIENAARAEISAVTPTIPAFMLNASTRKMVEQLIDIYRNAVSYGKAGPWLDAAVRSELLRRGDQFAGPEWRASHDPKSVLLTHYDAVVSYVAGAVAEREMLDPRYADEIRQSLGVTLGYAAEAATQKYPEQFQIASNVWVAMQDAVRSGDSAKLQELMRMGNLQPALKGVQGKMSEIEGYVRAMLAHLPVPEDTRTALMQTLQAERRIAPTWQALPDTTAGQFIKTLAPELVVTLRAGLTRDADGQWTLGEDGLAALKQQITQALSGFQHYRDDMAPGILREVESQIPGLIDMVLTYVDASRLISPDERDRLSVALTGGVQEALDAVRSNVRASAAASAFAKQYREDVFYWIQSLLMDARDIMARQYQGLTTEMQGTTQKMGLHQRIIEGLNELISFTSEDATSDAIIPYSDFVDDDDNPRSYYKRAREILVDMWTAYNQINEGPALDGHTAYWNEQGTIPVAMVRADDPRVKEAGTVILNDLLLDKMRPDTPEKERLVHTALFVGSGVTLGGFPLSIAKDGGYATLEGVKMGIAEGYVFIQDRTLYTTVMNDPRTHQNDTNRDGYEVLGLNFPVSVGHYQAFTREKATNTMQVFTGKVDQMGREQSIAATGVTNASNMMSASLDAVRKIVKDMSDWISNIIVGMR